MYYAQNGEDKWLEENWAKLGLPEHGIFVEVGVGDGTFLSQTLWLEERGWTGLLIEPDPRLHEAIGKSRKATLVPCAVGSDARPFGTWVDPYYSGFLRTVQGGSPITVPVRSLTEIFDSSGITNVDVLSIDTEGTEIEVWKTLDLTRFRPRVVFMEWDTYGIGQNAEGVTQQLEADGYTCAAILGCNLVFVPKV